MNNKLEIAPEFYQIHVGVPFKKISILWQLLDQRKEVVCALVDFKARRYLRKELLMKSRYSDENLPTSKFIEKNIKKHLSNDDAKKAIEDLNAYVGDFLDSLSKSLGNHYFLVGLDKQLKVRKQYILFRKENPRMSKREISKSFRILHPELNPATIRTWNSRMKR